MSGLLYLQPPCRGLAVVLEKRAGAGGVGPEDKREMQGENRRSNFALFLEGCPGLFLLPTGFLGGGGPPFQQLLKNFAQRGSRPP